ncbi:MAG: hypothetical protein OEX07_07485 [Gammaproteobacteria bacterium]|nr:hypothetical protein [Gammaproteobacteria bacterium]
MSGELYFLLSKQYKIFKSRNIKEGQSPNNVETISEGIGETIGESTDETIGETIGKI